MLETYEVSKDGFDPTDLPRIEELHQLLGVVLRQHRAGQVAGLEQPEVRLEQGVAEAAIVAR